MTRKYSLKFPNIVKVAFFSLSPKLQKLDLELKYKPYELDFDDDGLRTVANACSHLRQIVLSRRLRVGDLGVDSIVRSYKNLQELDFTGCLSVTNESLKAIGESNSFLNLNMRGCLISDLGLEYIANGNLKNSLEMLFLGECDRISDLGVDSIVRSCKNLQELDLSGCLSITDESLKAIGESNSLLILNLSDCLITDMGLEYLADGNLMNSLTGLDLSGCDRISDDGICYLNEFDNLTDLSLSRCDRCLTEDVIGAISHIPNIFFSEYCVG
ncbi:leucine-rich repeat, cysteine-containing subtype protein [Tanacetum coccineum]|uniref:Leucine-rich repeat, cysteine-containing subtype protein n=1 Tax=Tanacetum coccineum TaxID=301880 RepID=A0ABQ4ZXV0_9ASTR